MMRNHLITIGIIVGFFSGMFFVMAFPKILWVVAAIFIYWFVYINVSYERFKK